MNDDPENTQRFGSNQDAKDVTILLYHLATLCLEHMDTFLYGQGYKHGYLLQPNMDPRMHEHQKENLLEHMMDLAQEIHATKEDVMKAWDEVAERRKGDGQHRSE